MIIDTYRQTAYGLEFIFSGFLYSTYDDNFEYDELLLCKEPQKKIESISLFDKIDGIKKLFNNPKIQVSYYCSDVVITLDDIEEQIVLFVMGLIDTNKEKREYRYSEWTQGTNYDTTLEIGGHNLYTELYDLYNKYVIFKIVLLNN